MTASVANTSNTNSWSYLINRVNELAYSMSNQTVTVNSNTAIGNATVQGTISANVFQISNSTGTFVLTPIFANTNILISGSSSNTIVDSFSITDYNSVEYVLSVKDNVANNYFSSKVLLTHDGGNPYMVEYGSITTNTDLGAFSSYSNATHVTLNFNGTSSNSTVKFARIAV